MPNSFSTRRNFFKLCATAGLGALAMACSPKRGDALSPREKRLLQHTSTLPIVTWNLRKKEPGSVLRKKAALAGSIQAKRLARMDALMRATLKKSGGVGLAAPQVGLSRALFLVQLQNDAREDMTCMDTKLLSMPSRMV